MCMQSTANRVCFQQALPNIHSHRLRVHLRRRTAMSATEESPMREAVRRARTTLPTLDDSKHKGQAGRLAVLGGCADYTGAPFFAAMSALRAGFDQASIVTSVEAAPAIKAYSPDLIVVPVLYDLYDAGDAAECAAVARAHALVVGPGLGRSQHARLALERIIANVPPVPIVFDADALFFFAQSPRLLHAFTTATAIDGDGGNDGDDGAARTARRPTGAAAFVTPNTMELRRLCDALGVERDAAALAAAVPGVIVLAKGAVDRMAVVKAAAAAATVVDVDVAACGKRVAGQGDVLAGLLAAFAAWAHMHGGSAADAAVAASVVARTAGARAFDRFGRGVLASHFLQFVSEVVDSLESGEESL